MRDMSSAHAARTGSGLGILPANSGGIATQPRAPGHERPSAAQRAAGHGRLSAASTAPGSDVPRATTARAPGHDCQSAAPRAPGPDAPLASTASASRHDRLSAAHPVSDHNRSGATLAAASAPDHSPVSLPPAAGHDCSRRVPVAAGSPPASVTHPTSLEETVYDRMFTAAEVQALAPTSGTPVLAAEVRLLQMLIYRLVARGPALARPRNRRRGAAGRRRPRTVLLQQIAAICHAVDVLQRLLKTQRALGPDASSALNQLLDEAAKYLDNRPLPADSPSLPGKGPGGRSAGLPPQRGGHRGARRGSMVSVKQSRLPVPRDTYRIRPA